jgi:hypothetical protein
MLTLFRPTFRRLRSFGQNGSGLVPVERVALASIVVIGSIIIFWMVMNYLPVNNAGRVACEVLRGTEQRSVAGC